jgi:uncharacterized membrane protein
MMSSIFTEDELQQIRDAIALAELRTSGEIRVHIDKKCFGNPVKKAIRVFNSLGMYRTKQRNAVLIYVATQDHKLAIIGDQGINAHVPDHFWDDEREFMISYFKQGNFVEGLIGGILKVGEQMKLAFPFEKDDVNELDNEITLG